jgi:hypothetical protein
LSEDDPLAVGTLHTGTSAGDREEPLSAESRSHDRFTRSVAHDVTATGQQPQVALADALEQRHLPQQMLHGGPLRVARPVTGDRLGQVNTAGLRDAGMPNVSAHTPVVSGTTAPCVMGGSRHGRPAGVANGAGAL